MKHQRKEVVSFIVNNFIKGDVNNLSENVNNNSISETSENNNFQANNNSLAELKYQQRLIELRRSRVSELWVQGLSQMHISQELHISQSTVSLDIQWLKEQAREQLKNFITSELPTTVAKSKISLDLITQKLWATVAQAEREGDNKIKLQALSQINQVEAQKIEIVSNLGIVDSVVGAAEQRQQAPALPNLGEPIEEEAEENTSDDKSTDNLVVNQPEDSAPTKTKAIPVDGEDR